MLISGNNKYNFYVSQGMWYVADNKFLHHVSILDDKIESDSTAPVMHHQCALFIAQCYDKLLQRKMNSLKVFR